MFLALVLVFAKVFTKVFTKIGRGLEIRTPDDVCTLCTDNTKGAGYCAIAFAKAKSAEDVSRFAPSAARSARIFCISRRSSSDSSTGSSSICGSDKVISNPNIAGGLADSVFNSVACTSRDQGQRPSAVKLLSSMAIINTRLASTAMCDCTTVFCKAES